MTGVTVDEDFTGILNTDDFVLAVNTGDSTATVPTYVVVQDAIEGVDAQLNATTTDKTYSRAGQSSTKTGTQRTFSISGDRMVGDAFQDYAFSLENKYGVGAKVITDYVFFDIHRGIGEKGKVSVIVNSDGSGNAGETAGIDIELRKFGATPTEFTWAPQA
jgi:hypothetical protein